MPLMSHLCSISMNNWIPTNVADFITVTWDFGSNPLKPSRIRQTDLTLNVAANIEDITNFSFEIKIRGTEVV